MCAVPVSVVKGSLAGLEHCWSRAIMVKVNALLQGSGGTEHVLSDVALQSKLCSVFQLSVIMTT